MTDDASAPRLMLVTPELAETEAFLPALEAALAAGDVAAVAIRLAPADDRARIARAKPLIAAAQGAGAAALIAGEGVEDIVGKSGADGVHVVGEAAAAEAVERFQPEKIVGAAVSRSRDDAMTAGERGVDYVLFGMAENGAAWSAEQTLERVAWWVPIFETPCVGFAGSLDDVAALATTGVEFVGLGDAVWRHESGPAAAVAAAHAAISLARAPTP
ncbi:thiamine phosphate synthase [Methylopila turkensis]|uniref:Thiamine phosphate synthase n=1 Tax=Methylopila turkensis TaxID=1437816 RepID=A0A9W6JLH5_9HYPH|nr:thiamine phosphate synthase [Methylopila turkensis]GLK78606.1 thiamine phosphate synthase [Methylopila turkensis]